MASLIFTFFHLFTRSITKHLQPCNTLAFLPPQKTFSSLNRDYAMRKKKILLTGTLLFMSWGTIQLYLFVHKPQYQIFRSVSGEEKKEFL